MDTAITGNLMLYILGIIVAVVAGIAAISTLIKWINESHDKKQKYDTYEEKLKQIQAEQCMLTYCMMATLDGLHQLGCNGPVTKAREDLSKFMNKQAHEVKD